LTPIEYIYNTVQKAGPELKTVFIDSEMKFAMTESHFLSYIYN
jgi:hypothetical protein